jgi:hypothetical protein
MIPRPRIISDPPYPKAPMQRSIRTILTGILLIAFGGLGIYCSARGFMASRALHGRPDIDDQVRNWSTGATACFLAAGIASVLARRRQEADAQSQATGQPANFKWWKSSIGITLCAVSAILLGIVITLLISRSRSRSPTVPDAPVTVKLPASSSP